MRHARREKLAFLRLVAADDQQLGAQRARVLDAVPLGRVQMALRRRLRTQRARLEPIELRMRLIVKSTEPRRERLGPSSCHGLQHARTHKGKSGKGSSTGRSSGLCAAWQRTAHSAPDAR